MPQFQPCQIQLDNKTRDKKKAAAKTEELERPGSKFLKKEHEDQVQENPIGTVDPILALTPAAWMMRHHYLSDTCPVKACQDGDKAVQLSVKEKILG